MLKVHQRLLALLLVGATMVVGLVWSAYKFLPISHNSDAGSKVVSKYSNASAETRLKRINEVYTNLNLPSTFEPQRYDVFGDLRQYDWDQSRSYSSEIVYQHDDTVSATVAELRPLIEKAGFKYFEEPYPGSLQVQLHFKSNDDIYLRLNVSSKPYAEAYRLQSTKGSQIALPSSNAGPSIVAIKVNLDTNNE